MIENDHRTFPPECPFHPLPMGFEAIDGKRWWLAISFCAALIELSVEGIEFLRRIFFYRQTHFVLRNNSLDSTASHGGCRKHRLRSDLMCQSNNLSLYQDFPLLAQFNDQ
jgi:hypothetical protein